VTLRAGEVFENPGTGSRLEIISTPRDGDSNVLVAERLLKPGTGRADPHVHHDFEHRFAVMDGQLTLELDGEKRSFGVGEEVSVPIRTPHMDPYNDGNDDLRFRTEFEPATEFAEGFTAAFGHLLREGRTNDQDFPPDGQLFVCLHAYKGKSYAAGPPIWLQKPVLPLLALIGRLRGYKPSY
jgi:mannose-6-phosphate isomerase-like protein (cupin superfamily)